MTCIAKLVLISVLTAPCYAQGIVAASVQQSTIRSESSGIETLISLDLQGAPLKVALTNIAEQISLKPAFAGVVEREKRVVTLHVNNVSARHALSLALQGTGITYVVSNRQLVFERMVANKSAKVDGVIAGKVTDSKTGRGVSGANISVGSDSRGVMTGEDGTYRLAGVAAGTHALTVRLVGYAKQTRTVTVGEGAVVTVDFKIEPSASVLDQVVVTGTVVATELKAVPNAITVITAKQIEERGITKIDQLFRGDIPGLFAQIQGSYPGTLLDEVTMFSRGATALSTSSAGVTLATGNTNPIKTYVDGVELADPKYLSQIDPRSIERIEILTGPQASTIYGSNAINGVMQVFTKRGATSRPQLSLNLLSGWVENDFSSARTPQHDYSAQLNGLEGRLSYNAGGSWNYMGPWTPGKQSARTGGFGGARLDLPTLVGRVTVDVTLRRSITQTLQRGHPSQTVTGYQETGWYNTVSSSGLIQPTTSTLTGQTLGLTLGYAPTSWWSHELGIGVDASDAEARYTARGYTATFDTTLRFQQNHTDRRSFRYTTTTRVPVTSFAQATVTAGADVWQNLTSRTTVFPQTLTGSLTGVTSISRQPGHNTGSFLQTQLGVRDRLFFTYGLRAEWNPGFGAEAQPNYAPRYGIAYTQDIETPFGAVTAKLRGSYGRSTRPPQPKLKVVQPIVDYYSNNFGLSVPSSYLQYYGNFDYYLANPELGPEYQQGGEGGLELYLGTRGSLVVTRYNQTVDGLIAAPVVDSVRSLSTCPSGLCTADNRDPEGYGYIRQFQYLNIGTIRNQGWELQGNVQVGPITTRGTYSWTKSRTIGVNSKYRTFFANQAQYQPGTTFRYLPEHTWALGVMYATLATVVGLNVTGTGLATNQQDNFYFQNFDSRIRLPQNQLNVSNTGSYINFNSGYAISDLTASHRFLPRVEGVLQVQNLTNHYTNDYYSVYATMGRQTKLGARIKL